MADAAHSVIATFIMRAHTMFSIMSILKFVVKQSRASLSRVRLCMPWDRFVGAGLAARHGITCPSARPARGGRQHRCFLEKQLPLELPSLLTRSEGSKMCACARSSAQRVRTRHAPVRTCVSGATTTCRRPCARERRFN